MSDKIKVSVILPSLNVAQYVEQCIVSVRNQTLREIEIICVDAGSTDGTYELLEKYTSIDARIKLIASEKKSYGYQVNLGLQQAKGEFFAIVDTDDMVKENMYQTLYEIATKEDVDFVKANYMEFTMPADSIQIKREVPIVEDVSLYHRVIDITKAQKCFHPQTTATWSGIYRKSFLEENHIRHNETAGASYQDAGFLILTYMYAKRAYFVNQPFYMYRVDNPNSSVVNRNKVYCICDEFDFIWDIVRKNEALDSFKGTLSWLFYKKYKRNTERIAEEFREEFIERFANDFRQLKEEGYCTNERFLAEEWKELVEILEKGAVFYKETVAKKQRFLEELSHKDSLIIYGGGKVGKEILQGLKNRDGVLCFATTEKSDEQKNIDNVEVRCIEDLGAYKENASVIIAVMHAEFQKKMIEKANAMGFENIITVPFGVFDY